MKYKYILLSLLICMLVACMPPKKEESEVSTPPPAASVSVRQKGEQLFKQHCSACHLIDKRPLVGPGLKGIREKYSDDPKWIYEYIRDNVKLIKAGDTRAIAIYEANGKMVMSAFPFLTDEDIDAILLYIDGADVTNSPKH